MLLGKVAHSKLVSFPRSQEVLSRLSTKEYLALAAAGDFGHADYSM